jgi:hypothetical protein
MLRNLFLLVCLASLPAQAEQLYKCLDAGKQVTYSNLPCSKFPGLKEAKVIQPEPAPPSEPSSAKARETEAVPEPKAKTEKKTASERAEARRVLKVERAEKNKCNKLSDQISDVMDKMDAARHKGYTAKQEADWKQKIQELNAKKTRLNCF